MHSISPRICRITRLESPHIMIRLRSILVRSSKHKSSPLYSASFTVRSVTNLDSATRIVHSGSFHSIALNAPPLFLILADPSKLATIRGCLPPLLVEAWLSYAGNLFVERSQSTFLQSLHAELCLPPTFLRSHPLLSHIF